MTSLAARNSLVEAVAEHFARRTQQETAIVGNYVQSRRRGLYAPKA